MHEGIYEELKDKARSGGITFYGVIAPLADLDMGSEHGRAELGRLLGEISTYEHEQERPLLSAIVVHQNDGRPGQGFYSLAHDLSLLLADRDRDTYWQEEVKRVHGYWLTH